MITCKKCGNQVEEGNTNCPNCGENLINSNVENEMMNEKTQIFKGGLISNQELNPTPITPETTITEPTPEPIINTNEQTNQFFDNNTANSNVQSFDNNTATSNIQSFDNNTATSNVQSFDNNTATSNIQSFDNNTATSNVQSFDNNTSGIATNIGQTNGIKNNKIIIIVVAVAVVVIAAIILLLPIFNNKTVECSKEENQNGIGIKSEIITSFNGNKVNTITIKATYTLSNQYKEYYDSFYDTIQSEAKQYEIINGVKATTTKKDNKITLTVTSDRESAEKLFETTFNGKNENPDSFIKAAEEQGMTCKK